MYFINHESHQDGCTFDELANDFRDFSGDNFTKELKDNGLDPNERRKFYNSLSDVLKV
jgi:hypothetical protein